MKRKSPFEIFVVESLRMIALYCTQIIVVLSCVISVPYSVHICTLIFLHLVFFSTVVLTTM